jgi:large subunit ribosomal protein L32
MGLPSKKRTNRSKRERAAHFALSKTAVSADSEGNAQLAHRVNPTTGMYRGRQVIDVQKRAARLMRKTKKA